jgi:hypothetical protein
MGLASFTVIQYARTRGTGAASIASSKVRTSGAYTTSGAATNIEDAGGDITLAVGDVFQCHADVAMRLSFGGVAATATTGHFIPAGAQVEIEVADAGFVSSFDA